MININPTLYHITEPEPYDVVIVGGGAAGIGAAVGARQAAPDARILLIESEGSLGGAATHRNVVSFCGLFTIEDNPRQAVGAIWDDLFVRLRHLGGTYEKPTRHRGVFQVVDPEILKVVLDDVMISNDIDVLLHTMVTGGQKKGSHVHLIEIQERRGRRYMTAKAFVDCSGDGDLAFHVGASTRYGNHGTVNLGSLATRFGGFSPSAKPSTAQWREAIIQAKRKDPTLKQLCKKEASVHLKLPQSGDIVVFLASAAYDARYSASISAAEASGRKQALAYRDILRKLPGHENMYLVACGPNFGTRESRHVNAEYCLSEDDIINSTAFDDTIAIGAWGIEFHDESSSTWESTFRFPPNKTFQIPLRCLQSRDTPNLLVAGRCVDGDQYGGSAIRVMGTALATGQAAGVAAGLYSTLGVVAPANEVRACLSAHGAFLDARRLPEIGGCQSC